MCYNKKHITIHFIVHEKVLYIIVDGCNCYDKNIIYTLKDQSTQTIPYIFNLLHRVRLLIMPLFSSSLHINKNAFISSDFHIFVSEVAKCVLALLNTCPLYA